MKFLPQATLVAVLVGVSSCSFAQVAGETTPATRPKAQLITPPQDGLTVDDYAVELAKTANRNLIMDATDVSTDFRMPSYPTKRTPDLIPVYEFVLEFFRGVGGLSNERHGTTTLLWNSPNPIEFANAIVASDALQQTNPLEEAEKAKIVRDLVESAQKDNGWTKNVATGDYNRQEIKIVDLPETLRASVLQLAHQEVIASAGDYRSWMSDDFWKTALMRPNISIMSGLEGQFRPYIELSTAPSMGGEKQPFYAVLPLTAEMKRSNSTNKQLVDLYNNIRSQLHQ